MNDSLSVSFWLMIFLQTMGSVDMPGSGERKMPAPRAYLATIAIWGILSIGADAGWTRATSAMAWLVVAAGAVVGPFGKQLVKLVNRIADTMAPPPTDPFAPGGSAFIPGFSTLSPTPPGGTP